MNSTPDRAGESGAFAARHALGWLAVANGIGVWLAALLLWPDLGRLAGDVTYGRWVPLHLNLQLYGWTSLPLIGWLFAIYGVDRSSTVSWAPSVIRAWSAALVVGAAFWLSGHTSGKLFLDWKSGSLAAFMIAQVLLWGLLATAWWNDSRAGALRLATFLGLIVLAMVPPGLWIAASPSSYPPIDVTTGGPTGGSLLGSTLPVVLLLLWTPRVVGLDRDEATPRWITWLWVGEALAFVVLERFGGTHRMLRQIGGLGLLLPWLMVVPRDWRHFQWPNGARFWKNSALVWWIVLIIAGWLEYLPGVLDRMKFTSGLVAHAHLAMAGFTSSFGLLLITLTGGAAARQAISRGGRCWHLAVAAHVIALLVCGWLEGGSTSWMDHRPAWREVAFLVRLSSGVVMAGLAVYWWLRSFADSDSSPEFPNT